MSGQTKWKEEQILVICPGSRTTMAQLGCNELTPPAYRIPTRMFLDEETKEWRPYRTWKRRKTAAAVAEAAAASGDLVVTGANGVGSSKDSDEWEYVEDPDSDEGAVYPLQGGYITNMPAFLAFLEHVHGLLTTTHHTTPIVLMTSPQWTRPDVEAIALYIFETTKTPALCMIHSAIATQYGLKWPHMTVIDIGFEKVDVTCIYESRIVGHMNLGYPDELGTMERSISGGEVFTQRLHKLLQDRSFTYEMAEQLKKSAICEVLPYAPTHPKLMELPYEEPSVVSAATGAASGAAGSGQTQDVSMDDGGLAVERDGVLDVAKIVTSGQTKEFLAKKDKEKSERGRFGRRNKDKEAEAAKPVRLPNSKRARTTFHFEDLVEDDEEPQPTAVNGAAAHNSASATATTTNGTAAGNADASAATNGHKAHDEEGSEEGSEDGSEMEEDDDEEDGEGDGEGHHETSGEASKTVKEASAPAEKPAAPLEEADASTTAPAEAKPEESSTAAKPEETPAAAAPAEAEKEATEKPTEPAAEAAGEKSEEKPAAEEAKTEPAAPATDAPAPAEVDTAKEDTAMEDAPADVPVEKTEAPAKEAAKKEEEKEDAAAAPAAETPAEAKKEQAAAPAAEAAPAAPAAETAGVAPTTAATTTDVVPAAAADPQSGGRRLKRVRRDFEIGLERFTFADREEIDRIVTTIYRTVQGIEDMYMRPACWDNLVFVGNGCRLRGLRENILQTLVARHLVSPSTATMFTSELPSHLGTPSGTGAQTPTGLVGSSGGVNPLLQAATTASLQAAQQGSLTGPGSNAGGGHNDSHSHGFHAQTPTSIKLATLPTYLGEWTKNGFEEAMFLGSQVAARLAFCVHNLDAQGHESQKLMSLSRIEYNDMGPKGIRTHSMLG